jgi:hypothetical protein
MAPDLLAGPLEACLRCFALQEKEAGRAMLSCLRAFALAAPSQPHVRGLMMERGERLAMGLLEAVSGAMPSWQLDDLVLTVRDLAAAFGVETLQR